MVVVRWFWRVQDALDRLFNKPLLILGIVAFVLSWQLWPHTVPDDSRPFVTLLEAAAQADVLGLAMPWFLIAVGVIFVLLSLIAKGRGGNAR